MKRPLIGTALALVMLACALVVMGCGAENTSAKSDETVCVFDGSERGSQKLKYQILPGENPRHADDDDEIVRIPTSFRFYAAFIDRSIADAGAPEFYTGYARGDVPVAVQGTYRFRFNVDNACEWYARHGRRNARNGDLGFNARSDEAASSLSPWVRWLNENFGTTGAATIKSSSRDFTWPELTYGNDPEAPRRPDPVDIVYGKTIGRIFTNRLNNSLGGRFFCGTDVTQWGTEDIDRSCPPIFFQTGPIHPTNPKLEKEREETEALRAELENAETSAKIRAATLQAQLKDQAVQQQLLAIQVATARLKTLSKEEVQKCIAFAKVGLDCAGNRPDLIIAGSSR